MADAIIENPVINSAFAEPHRHFQFTETGLTNEIVEASYFIPNGSPTSLHTEQWNQSVYRAAVNTMLAQQWAEANRNLSPLEWKS